MFPPQSLRPVLTEARWFEGRRVTFGTDAPRSHPALEVLAGLSGLTLAGPWTQHPLRWAFGLGFRRSRTEELICFEPLVEKYELVKRWEAETGTTMVGIGEIQNRHAELYMDSNGRLFGNSIIACGFYFVGWSFEEGIAGLLADRRSRPMILPEEESVSLYDRNYVRGDAELITPEMLR